MKSYGGMASANGGVVGMLEVIVSDFVRLEAEPKAAESKEFVEPVEYDEWVANNESAASSFNLKSVADCH